MPVCVCRLYGGGSAPAAPHAVSARSMQHGTRLPSPPSGARGGAGTNAQKVELPVGVGWVHVEARGFARYMVWHEVCSCRRMLRAYTASAQKMPRVTKIAAGQ